MQPDPLSGMRGEVFAINGRMGGSIGCPSGIAGAIPYVIGNLVAGPTPWREVIAGHRAEFPCRINPALVESPLFRLFDVMYLASHYWDRFPDAPEWMQLELPEKPHPDSLRLMFTILTARTLTPSKV